MTVLRSTRDRRVELERAGWAHALDEDSWRSLEDFLTESNVTVPPGIAVFSDGEVEAWWPVHADEERILSVRFTSDGSLLVEKRDADLETDYWVEVERGRLLDFVNAYLPTQ